jgi:hypothetical protein
MKRIKRRKKTLRNEFAKGVFLGILGSTIFKMLPDEVKINLLKTILKKAEKPKG